MWKKLKCHLLGGHDYSVCCEPGTIFLRCHCCGSRSPGWSIDERPATAVQTSAEPAQDQASRAPAHVLPFGGHVVAR